MPNNDEAAFRSILFEDAAETTDLEEVPEPEFFADLHLGQIVDSIVSGWEEYQLKPLFSIPLVGIQQVWYRQEAVRDLQLSSLSALVTVFAQNMRDMRESLSLSKHASYRQSSEGWFLHSAIIYCDALRELKQHLARIDLNSKGFLGLRGYLADYVESEFFVGLSTEAEQIKARLSGVAYSLTIFDDRITVTDFNGEPAYSPDVEATFAKFKRDGHVGNQKQPAEAPEMNHVEAAIAAMVARLNPEVFDALHSFCERHAGFPDVIIETFDREVQFYMAYLAYVERLTQSGLSFCEARLRDDSKTVRMVRTFDLALADKLLGEGGRVVCNDFALAGNERIAVITGPNQGGKTTFARTFGQLHYLARLGLPVPGDGAELFLCDQIFTHFEKQENPLSRRGKLQEDLIRVREILEVATSNSIVILNEIFTSTTAEDAVFLGTKVLRRLVAMDILTVCVTFLDELASMGEATVSLVSTVDPEDPAVRTFKIVRMPADGLAYAENMADKYRVSYRALSERLNS